MPANILIGNWIINLSVILCNLNIIISVCKNGNGSTGITSEPDNMPPNWPCEWNNGRIPFMFNLFSMTKNRNLLINLVKSSHEYLEANSCLVFEELDPRQTATINLTYIYYMFSGALESCCLTFYKKPVRRRTVLITPICRMPGEIAHVTLHGMGVVHNKREQFSELSVTSVLFPPDCKKSNENLKAIITDML